MKSLNKYLKFGSLIIIGLFNLLMLSLGEVWMWGTLTLCLVFAVVGNPAFERDLDEPEVSAAWVLDVFLYLSLFIVLAMTVIYGWYLSSGDPFGIGAYVHQHLSYDLAAARAETTSTQMVVAFSSLSITCVLVAANVRRELPHRAWGPTTQLIGRWLSSFSFDGSFSIEHVYAHHHNVATDEDHRDRGRQGEEIIALSNVANTASLLSRSKPSLRPPRRTARPTAFE